MALIAVLAGGSSGCDLTSWQGLNSLPLPGTTGNGPGSFEIKAEMPDINNIQPNSRVRVGDATVGHITKIELQGWHALVTMRLDGGVAMPANAIAKIGLTSILGSQHIELSPPTDEPAQGRLHEGSLIPLSHSASYPTVEQTLAAVSMVLNGGGLGQVQDITEAFSTAFRGREQDLRSMISELDKFAANFNDQTDDVIAATESLNKVAGTFAANQATLDKALKTVPEALAVLNNERENLAEAADALGKFGERVVSTVDQSKASLVKELKDIGPVLESLANAGPSMTRALSLILTFPFPNETIEKWQRGDYANMTAIVDLTLSRIDQGIFTGTRWEGDLTELEMQWGRTIGQFPSPYTKANPLVAPYRFDQGP
ncbi:virulence factor Mce family protein [Mycobacterium sp. NBC_00419]|uniref:virulence factor Mce family protein n=1 Tax=Mycobacterium sp. NBC_00419 TaxID=2975989 RepID=UPI002E2025E2